MMAVAMEKMGIMETNWTVHIVMVMAYIGMFEKLAIAIAV